MIFNAAYRGDKPDDVVIRKVDAEPINVNGLTCFVYCEVVDGTDWHHVCEHTSGRSIGNHRSREYAIIRAKLYREDVGLARIKADALAHGQINR